MRPVGYTQVVDMRMFASFLIAALVALACAKMGAPRADCGTRPQDWCTSVLDGPCGAHPDEKSCRLDPKCKGMPYRGESVVACVPDGHGFSSNCPSVGCIARL
jgi:hypothetical protein